jgi:hypothetical protein
MPKRYAKEFRRAVCERLVAERRGSSVWQDHKVSDEGSGSLCHANAFGLPGRAHQPVAAMIGAFRWVVTMSPSFGASPYVLTAPFAVATQ